MLITEWDLHLPEWLVALMPEIISQSYITDEERMRLAIDLSQRNVEHGTGGPFGAAIFHDETGEVFSLGVNQVVPQHCSAAHAEVMAIMAAQKKVKNFSPEVQKYHLASSAQPCAMCTGALAWSGLSRLTYAATKEDVERLTGFDEGPLHPQWQTELQRRGIQTSSHILRDEACQTLKFYKDNAGIVYNGRS